MSSAEDREARRLELQREAQRRYRARQHAARIPDTRSVDRVLASGVASFAKKAAATDSDVINEMLRILMKHVSKSLEHSGFDVKAGRRHVLRRLDALLED